MQISRARLALAVVVLALTGSGCAGSGGGSPNDSVAATGLSVSVLQYRSDYTIRRMQLQVANAGPNPVTVTVARLNSTAFTGEAAWHSRDRADETKIAPGTATDLPSALPPSACDSSTFTTTARLELRLADGTIGRTVALPVRDPFGSVLRVHTEDCRRKAALDIADLTLLDPLRRSTRNGKPIAMLDLRLTPSGKPGTLTAESIGSTTLLGPPTGPAWKINRKVSAETGPQTVPLELRAARCDPHAIAEDKLGTVMPLMLHVNDGESGIVTVAADPQLRIQIQRFVHDACAAS